MELHTGNRIGSNIIGEERRQPVFYGSFASIFKNYPPGTTLNQNIQKTYGESITSLNNRPDVNLTTKFTIVATGVATFTRPVAYQDL